MFLRGNLEITAPPPPLLSTFKIPVYGDRQEATGVSDFVNKIAQFHTGNLSVDHSLSFFFQNKSPGIILGIEQNYLNSFFFSVVVPNYLMDIVYTIFSIFCFLFFSPNIQPLIASNIQVQPQKVDSVHLAVTFSVGETVKTYKRQCLAVATIPPQFLQKLVNS